MRFPIPFVLLAASLFASGAGFTCCHGDENLFSQIAMESVYASDTVTSLDLAVKNDGKTFERVTGASSLVPALEAAGFEPRRDRNRVTAQIDQAGWKLSIQMRVEIEKDRIVCDMSLVTLKDASTVVRETLLDLLARGDVVNGMFFAYDSKRKVIQLKMSLANRGITADGLKADLVKFAAFAEAHADVWSQLGQPLTPQTDRQLRAESPAAPPSQSSAQASTSANDPATTTATPSSAKLSLIGRWGATLAENESFAILIGADARFKLVHVKGDKSGVSSGKITRLGDRLTLVGDDQITITGKLTQTAADRFQLAILKAEETQSQAVLNFVRAN